MENPENIIVIISFHYYIFNELVILIMDWLTTTKSDNFAIMKTNCIFLNRTK